MKREKRGLDGLVDETGRYVAQGLESGDADCSDYGDEADEGIRPEIEAQEEAAAEAWDRDESGDTKVSSR